MEGRGDTVMRQHQGDHRMQVGGMRGITTETRQMEKV